jgi:hypothetical protein
MEHVIFALAQYIPDLLRQEPRNIGVLVADDSRVLARFLGEDSAGVLSLKSIPEDLFNDIDLYLDWHEYWSSQIRNTPSGIGETFLRERLIRNKGKAFAVVHGGEYEPDDEKTLEQIAAVLFARLVQSDPGAATGDNALSMERRGGYLGRRIASELRRIGILEGAKTSENLFVRHPVRAKVPVFGMNPVPHTPDFYQENGRRYVMEQVDFSVQTLARARDHAMYAQYILADIVESVQNLDVEDCPLYPIAIVNRVPRTNGPMQEYALAALSSIPRIEMVYWDRDEERRRFLEERRAVAEVIG